MISIILAFFLSGQASAELINTKLTLDSSSSEKVYYLLEKIRERTCDAINCQIELVSSSCSTFDGFMMTGEKLDARCKFNFTNEKTVKKDNYYTKELYYFLLKKGVTPVCWSAECTIQFDNLICLKQDSRFTCHADLVEYRAE